MLIWQSILALILAWMCSSAARASDLTIAVIGPMSGQFAEFGAQLRAGVEQAVVDINASAGVNGRQITVIHEDDACDPAKAVTAAAKVAARRVSLVIGHFCSRASIPASRVYAQAGILQISPASTHPELTIKRAGPTIFRLSGRDDQQAKVAARYIAQKNNGRDLAIVHDESVFGLWLASQARRAIKAAGLNEPRLEALSGDLNKLVARLKTAGAETVYFTGNHSSAARMVLELRKQGMDTRLIGSNALATQEFWQATGAAGEGTVLTALWDPRSHPAAQAVVAKLRARRIEPERFVLFAYTAVEVWALAARSAGSVEAKVVSKYLSKEKFSTVLGTFSFDQKGDPSLSFFRLHKWRAGRYTPFD